MYFRVMLVSLFFFTLTACEGTAIMSTPKKKPVESHSQLAMKAENQFWTTLHKGSYQDIAQADYLLMAAYLQNPNDPKIAAHLGFLHIWKITERQREKAIPPTITNEIILSKKYFADAVELNPSDARFLGFYGDTELVEGKIFHDKREEVRGYFTLKRAINKWPEFNYFTAGYILSGQSSKSEHFKQALEWQWNTLDACAGEKVDRANPVYNAYMKRETQKGPQRACWNSWIAPYNFEGFMMNMGDMLVKSGDWQTAIIVYQNAKLEKNFMSWPYHQLLEKRIVNARDNVANFQKKIIDPDKSIMFNSGYGCAACHQQGSA